MMMKQVKSITPWAEVHGSWSVESIVHLRVEFFVTCNVIVAFLTRSPSRKACMWRINLLEYYTRPLFLCEVQVRGYELGHMFTGCVGKLPRLLFDKS